MNPLHSLQAFLLAGCLLFPSCGEKAAPAPERTDITFSVRSGGGSRLTDIDPDDASTVSRWTLLLYREGQLAGYWTAPSRRDITCSLEAGTYKAFAIANPPAGFRPETCLELSAATGAGTDLSDNAPDALVMAGSLTFQIPAAVGNSLVVSVERLVCKVVVQKISVDFTNPALAERTFVLKAVYLTNCCGESRYGSDLTIGEILSSGMTWYNPAGFHSDAGVNRLLADLDIDAAITPEAPHGHSHTFYCYPNALTTGEDNRSEEWSPRCTRLVLEATLGDQTYYYPVTIPEQQRNRSYIAEEIIIKGPGSLDPEGEIPGAVEVFFRTSTQEWAPEYNVTEDS